MAAAGGKSCGSSGHAARAASGSGTTASIDGSLLAPSFSPVPRAPPPSCCGAHTVASPPGSTDRSAACSSDTLRHTTAARAPAKPLGKRRLTRPEYEPRAERQQPGKASLERERHPQPERRCAERGRPGGPKCRHEAARLRRAAGGLLRLGLGELSRARERQLDHDRLRVPAAARPRLGLDPADRPQNVVARGRFNQSCRRARRLGLGLRGHRGRRGRRRWSRIRRRDRRRGGVGGRLRRCRDRLGRRGGRWARGVHRDDRRRR